ncbi:hypothetical protein KC19_VG131100 [Ceratodon purpureus]|uniref:Uncharacterized protein n=1 Tax=Ceratodon purpureus TaxID=3225 RepID=A0A8T0HPP4_CERPU|nr:hypothetical protein KC19_VG131100 [Ceratodon purpureus]
MQLRSYASGDDILNNRITSFSVDSGRSGVSPRHVACVTCVAYIPCSLGSSGISTGSSRRETSCDRGLSGTHSSSLDSISLRASSSSAKFHTLTMFPDSSSRLNP